MAKSFTESLKERLSSKQPSSLARPWEKQRGGWRRWLRASFYAVTLLGLGGAAYYWQEELALLAAEHSSSLPWNSSPEAPPIAGRQAPVAPAPAPAATSRSAASPAAPAAQEPRFLAPNARQLAILEELRLARAGAAPGTLPSAARARALSAAEASALSLSPRPKGPPQP